MHDTKKIHGLRINTEHFEWEKYFRNRILDEINEQEENTGAYRHERTYEFCTGWRV